MSAVLCWQQLYILCTLRSTKKVNHEIYRKAARQNDKTHAYAVIRSWTQSYMHMNYDAIIRERTWRDIVMIAVYCTGYSRFHDH